MSQSNAPFWVRIWVLLMALLSIGFVFVSYLNPGFFGAEWAAAGPEKFATVFGHYTGRNLSMGLVTLAALIMGRAQGMILVLGLRIVTDLADAVHQILAGTINTEFVVSASILVVVSGIAILKLWPLYKTENSPAYSKPAT